MSRDNYPLDCWYVAATSDEVSRRPLARRLLDRPVVLFRMDSGGIVALEDRCAHRGYPLSLGRVEGDTIVSGYHGITYDATGACVSVPSQPNVPYGLAVASFPVREASPFVWVWLGNPGRAALVDPPVVPELGPYWAATGETVTVDANYMLLHEHYLDLTHITEMHRDKLPPTIDRLPPIDAISVSETSVSFDRDLPPAPLTDWEVAATGLPRDSACARRHTGSFVTPALNMEGWTVITDAGRAYRHVRVHAVTPESPGRTTLFWHFARDYDLASRAVDGHLRAEFQATRDTDLAALEAIQANTDDPGWTGGTPVSADAGVIRARKIVASMLAAEGRASTAAGR